MKGVKGLILQLSKEIERENYSADAIYSINEPEIKSKKIGQVILDVLADKNKVAYIRFASVYNNFTCLEDFEKALDRVRSEG